MAERVSTRAAWLQSDDRLPRVRAGNAALRRTSNPFECLTPPMPAPARPFLLPTFGQLLRLLCFLQHFCGFRTEQRSYRNKYLCSILCTWSRRRRFLALGAGACRVLQRRWSSNRMSGMQTCRFYLEWRSDCTARRSGVYQVLRRR